MDTPVLHWFRRDLRLHDNPALLAAHRQHAGRVVPVYLQSAWRGAHPWTGPARQAALCSALADLSRSLVKAGTGLVIRRGAAVPELRRLLAETGARHLYYNRSPDPWGRALEDRVAALAREAGVEVHAFHEVTALEPGTVLTGGGEMFRVYTPYARAWMRQEIPAPLPAPGRFPPLPRLRSQPLPTLADWELPAPATPPDCGEPGALRRLERFLAGPVFRYAAERDLPGVDGTSRLSTDLRWGTVSIRHVLRRTREALAATRTAAQREGAQKFLNELVWREFYLELLWRWPNLLQEEFQHEYRGLRWRSDPADLERWKAGQTGFPIVDAGMRQLAATGWMHNRVRMIVAMFLTKDLHLDWREGEAHFMRTLADGEAASNNGGWQWSASTGADAAPYFRIQNPWTQSARFDPEGEYIRAWVPELREVPAAQLHRVPPEQLAPGYPPPMVDHARERAVALAMYR